jgi:NHLM bacteriocin system ABC transporter ATP-binding protein
MRSETRDAIVGAATQTHQATNTPFLLDTSTVHLVLEGKVDVFAVGTPEDGDEFGPRKFMFSVAADEALWGMNGARAVSGFGLLAVTGLNTRLVAVERQHFLTLAQVREYTRDVGALLDRYARRLSSAISRHDHRQFQPLTPAPNLQLQPGAIAGGHQHSAWVRHTSGTSCFAGVDHLVLDDQELFYPIAEGAWLASDTGAELEIIDTAQYLAQDPSWRGFDSFMQLFHQWLAHDWAQGEAAERRRLAQRLQSDRDLQQSSLADLASLMEQETVETQEERDDRLFAACQAVGRVRGIDFGPLPYWQEFIGNEDRLRALCQASCVGYRQVVLRDTWWKTDSGPLLAYVVDIESETGGPVALLPSRPGHYVLHNPAEQSQTAVDAEVAQRLEPRAFEFYRPLPNKILRLVDLGTYSLQDARWDLKSIAMLATVSALLGIISPVILGYLFNTVIPNAAIGQVGLLFVALVTVSITATIFQFAQSVALLRAEVRSSSSLQMAMVDRILRLPIPFFREYSAGDLAERLNGVNAVRQILGGATISLILSSLTSAGGLLLLFYYSSSLALVATAILFVNVAFTGTCAWYTLKYNRQLQDVSGRLSGQVLQLLGGIAKLRVSASETRAFAVWAELFRAQKIFAFQAGTWGNRVTVFNSATAILSTLLLFAVAGSMASTLSTGDFIAFHAAFGTFLFAGMALSEAFVQVLGVVPLIERATPLLETAPEVTPNQPDPGRLRGRIELSHVCFRYQPESPLVVDGLSLQVEPGEFVALVGPSGSGKSTILRLLLGFESPESGSIYYDGQEIRSVDGGAVRRQIGVVLQSGRLGSGTILNNIVGASSHTLEDAWEAVRQAGLEETIKQFPMGIQTVLNEGGTTLSGGQRQRLLIARALVGRPRILLFDEATSALDAHTQSVVAHSLEQLHATRIVVAHRLNSIREADRIFVIDGGRVVETGSYDTLLAEQGTFAELVQRQLA